MGTKYVTVPVTGYNATPPPDDGTTVDANKGKWSTIKTKLGDPLNTAIAAINTELVTALDQSATAVTTTYTTLATDHNKPIQCTGTFTLSLGDAASMGVGYVVPIFNIGTGIITLSRITGADTLNGATKDIKLNPKQGGYFAVNAAGNGYNSSELNPVITDPTDPSKQIKFDVSGITTATVRTLTVQDSSDTLVGRATTDTLTNKTLTSPTINGGAFTGGTDMVVADGGTGVSSLTAYAPVFGGTTSTGAVQSGTVGTSGQVLTSNGAGALPTFQAASASLSEASQADMEAFTSSTVFTSPRRVQNHPGVVKTAAGITCNGGAITTNFSYNISSMTRSSAGIYVKNFTTAYSAAKAYTPIAGVNDTDNANNNRTYSWQSQGTGAVTINYGTGAGAALDPAVAGSFLAVGDQ